MAENAHSMEPFVRQKVKCYVCGKSIVSKVEGIRCSVCQTTVHRRGCYEKFLKIAGDLPCHSPPNAPGTPGTPGLPSTPGSPSAMLPQRPASAGGVRRPSIGAEETDKHRRSSLGTPERTEPHKNHHHGKHQLQEEESPEVVENDAEVADLQKLREKLQHKEQEEQRRQQNAPPMKQVVEVPQDDEAINDAFERLANELNMPREAAKVMTPKMKRDFLAKNDKPNQSTFTARTPAYFASKLRAEPSAAVLNSLAVILRTTPLNWVKEFLDYGGLEVILRILKNSLLTSEKRTPDDINMQRAAVCVIKGISNNSLGLRAFMHTQDLIKILTFCLPSQHLDDRLKEDIMGLLIVAATYNPDELGDTSGINGQQLVVNAMNSLQEHLRERRRFQFITKAFKETDSLGLKARYLALINRIICEASYLDLRVSLRNEFLSFGIMETIEHLQSIEDTGGRAMSPVMTQVDLFLEQSEMDAEELNHRFDALGDSLRIEVGNKQQLFEAVSEGCGQLGMDPQLVSMMQSLAVILYSKTASVQNFLLCERLVRQISFQGSDYDPEHRLIGAEEGKIDYEHLLRSVANEAQVLELRHQVKKVEEQLSTVQKRFKSEKHRAKEKERKLRKAKAQLEEMQQKLQFLEMQLDHLPTMVKAQYLQQQMERKQKAVSKQGKKKQDDDDSDEWETDTDYEDEPQPKGKAAPKKLAATTQKAAEGQKPTEQAAVATAPEAKQQSSAAIAAAAALAADVPSSEEAAMPSMPDMSEPQIGPDGVPLPPPPPFMGGPGGPPPPPPPPGMGMLRMPQIPLPPAIKSLPKPPLPLKAIQWQKLPPMIFKNTIFANLKEFDGLLLPFEDILRDFAAKQIVKKEEDNKPKKAQVIDPKLAQNIAILLKGFKNTTMEQVVDGIKNCDETLFNDPGLVQAMRKCLPTKDDIENIKKYQEAPDALPLPVPEKFAAEMSHVAQVDAKLRALQFKLEFFSKVEDLKPCLTVVDKACVRVMESQRFKRLLCLVLLIGNYLNFGTNRGSCAGFKITLLAKLGETKSTDGKKTLMHLIADIISKDQPDLLKLQEEFAAVMASSNGFTNSNTPRSALLTSAP
eukprot:TRINITY_DN1816_c0_g2_i2.p1 TRINITY_DN1816_c0_g2~~TRINITY_DN1816_c0_g2_i2.p1  ORF type:complete len:1089 (+),score=342.29 TRINITY_DN1816_c0_g2_i2:102-3368(+)